MSLSLPTKRKSANRVFVFEKMTTDRKEEMKGIFSINPTLYRDERKIHSLTREEFDKLSQMIGSSPIYYAKSTIDGIYYLDDRTLKLTTIDQGDFKISIDMFMEYLFKTKYNDKFLLYAYDLLFLNKEIKSVNFDYMPVKRNLHVPAYTTRDAMLLERNSKKQKTDVNKQQGGNKIKKITRKVYLDDKGKSYIKYDNKIIYLKLN
jgi:hypothetical protein